MTAIARAASAAICATILAGGFISGGHWLLAAVSAASGLAGLPLGVVARGLRLRVVGSLLAANAALLIATVAAGAFSWWDVVAASLALVAWNVGIAQANWSHATRGIRRRYTVRLAATAAAGCAAGVAGVLLQGRIAMGFLGALALMAGAGAALIWILRRMERAE